MLSSANRFRARGAAALSIFVLAAVAAACSAGSASGPGGAPAATSAAGPVTGGLPREGEGNGEGNGNGQGGGDPGVVDQAGLLIVKTGALAIQVEGLDAAMTAASAQVAGLGGYASASNRSGDGDRAQATVTYRIPVARWDEALTSLRGLGEKILDERYSTEEVTAQVVDLEARITNLRATEAALQSIMERAVDIKDVLTVQAELTRVRSEIEQLTAQKTNLEGRAAFSTLAVTFAVKADPILAEQQGFDPANEVEQASASLVSVLQAVATAGIWFGIVWLPILLFIGLIAAIGWGVARRFRRAGDATTPLAAPGGGG